MVAHGAVCPLGIMRQDRLHDRLVLADSVGDPVRHARDPPAIGRHLIAQLAGLIGEERIARGLVDRFVEFLVDVVKDVDVAGCACGDKPLVNLAYFSSQACETRLAASRA